MVQAKHVVQKGPPADQLELKSKLTELQHDQALAGTNNRERHSQFVLDGFPSSIEQTRVTQQSLIHAVANVDNWRGTMGKDLHIQTSTDETIRQTNAHTINSMIVPLGGEGRRTTWTSHVKRELSPVVLLVTATFLRIQTMLNVRCGQVQDSNKQMRKWAVLLFVGQALL